MAVTRRIGNLRIHFLGDNAEQPADMFDDAHSRSKAFKRDMDETRTHKNIYVGSALADLHDQPHFGDAEFDPQLIEVKESPAFNKAAGAETHFIVVKPGSHSLIHDGQRFDGSTQLASVHELLHPSQMIRDLAQYGKSGEGTERQTQMREQRAAVELGNVPGKDFPDVIGSGAGYRALQNGNPRPNSLPSDDS